MVVRKIENPIASYEMGTAKSNINSVDNMAIDDRNSDTDIQRRIGLSKDAFQKVSR